MFKFVITATLCLTLSACSLAPKFTLPETQTAETYKEDVEGTWKQGEPAAHLDRGAWWSIFKDETLDKLEAEALSGNLPLQGMAARVTQARQTARIATSFLFPAISGEASAIRQQPTGVVRGVPGQTFRIEDVVRAGATASYEVDLFGRVGDAGRAATDDAVATEETYQSLKLALEADVASAYFTARALDADIVILEQGLKIREDSLAILQKRLEIGTITELDIAESVVDLETTRATLQAVRQQRKETENALALLLGLNPSNFKLMPKDLTAEIPVVPPGLPSELLERRPDVTAAQHTLAAANARIGVARAAFFPVLSLTASGGFESSTLGDVFMWSSRSWALGPLLSVPIFSGGATLANYRRSQATFEEAVGNYRQQVLIAFRDVEDGLSRIKTLSDQSISQAKAETAARRAADIAAKRYESGDVGYLESITARKNALDAERFGVTIKRDRLVAAVSLIRALGGGW